MTRPGHPSDPRLHPAADRLVVVILGVLCGCGRGDGGPVEPAGPALSALTLFPREAVDVVGARFDISVRAVDAGGTPRSDVVPAFSSSNTAVVRIEAGNIIAAGAGTATLLASAGGRTAEATLHVGSPTYDLEALGPPRILGSDYIDLSKIERISRFRSTVGHSYTTGDETCRSMKHYFQPKPSVDWAGVDVYAPAAGTIFVMAPDGAYGTRILLRPRDVAAMQVTLFHVSPDSGLVVGSWVESGEHIGRHSTSRTMSDIAMTIGPFEGGALFSYFDAMTDGVFDRYRERGVASRAAAIISREERDADSIECIGQQQFTVHGTLPDWLDLN